MARKYFQSVVTETQDLCGNVKHITLKPQTNEPFNYTPGQFIMIHFPNKEGIELNRSYSISAIPGETEGYALCVKKVAFGKGSTLLHNLEVGDEIKTSGPFGRFTLREETPKDVIMVATGTGVAPFRSMKALIKTRCADTRFWLLMGVRHCDELLYHEEWKALDEAQDNFHYRYTVSQPGDADWDGPVGYVGAFVEELHDHIKTGESVAYLCGVPPMIDAMRTAFLERGLTRREVRTEKFASPPDPRKKPIKAASGSTFVPKNLVKKTKPEP